MIIKPYTKFLIKQHLLYILAILVLLIISVTIPGLSFAKLSENKATATQLQEEVEKLRAKGDLLNDISTTEKSNINQDIQLLNSLVPDIEDYFSIITTLEELSKKTGFIVTSYNVIASDPLNKDKLTIDISGVGNNESFLNFLENYKFGGGRLITLDKIELKPRSESKTFSLRLNFYHKEVNLNADSNTRYSETLKIVQSLREKVDIVLKEPDELTQDYPTKKNPF